MTVAELRRQGCKVRINHYRRYNKHDGLANKWLAEQLNLGHEFKQMLPTGGLTRVEIDGLTQNTLVGEAVCSNADNYDKKLGIKIAIGRALKGR